jgi:hypothetical protein
VTSLGIPGAKEGKKLVLLSERLRAMLRRWKQTQNISRSEGLCACIVLVGTEGGLENAMPREAFLGFVTELLGWSYDLGVKARGEVGARGPLQ